MSLLVQTFTLGPLDNNTFLVWDEETKNAVLIDPTYDIQIMVDEITKKGLKLDEIWVTHAHFDHVIGIPVLLKAFQNHPKIGLHPADLELWQSDAGAKSFNLHISLPRGPDFFFSDNQKRTLGEEEIEVRHTPGHTPGHVIFYSMKSQSAFCGDVIFHHSIGRTDLPGGDYDQLISSIKTRVFSLPSTTRLLSGHGPETTIEEERRHNPFLK